MNERIYVYETEPNRIESNKKTKKLEGKKQEEQSHMGSRSRKLSHTHLREHLWENVCAEREMMISYLCLTTQYIFHNVCVCVWARAFTRLLHSVCPPIWYELSLWNSSYYSFALLREFFHFSFGRSFFRFASCMLNDILRHMPLLLLLYCWCDYFICCAKCY